MEEWKNGRWKNDDMVTMVMMMMMKEFDPTAFDVYLSFYLPAFIFVLGCIKRSLAALLCKSDHCVSLVCSYSLSG